MLASAVVWTTVAQPFTFLVSPDTHLTSSGGVIDVDKNARGIGDMNALPGTPYPNTSKWGGIVAPPRGVVLPGDLIDDGCSAPTSPGTVDPGCAAQWANYTALFRVVPTINASGSDDAAAASATAAAAYPAFESVGNHDGGNSTALGITSLVRRGVIARNRQRAALPTAQLHALAPNYNVSANGLHYSWDWSGVHFAMLGVYPGGTGDCASGTGIPGTGCAAEAPPYGWHSPEDSLGFLTADLAAVAPTTPVVLFTHYGLRGFGAPGTAPWAGYSPDFWWSAREAAAFATALAGHNVVALVHGHTHACVFYQVRESGACLGWWLRDCQ